MNRRITSLFCTALTLWLPALRAHAQDEDKALEGRPRQVLLIGDSHSVGYFGLELDRQLRAWSDNTASYAIGGSIPRWWLEGTKAQFGSVEKTSATTEIRTAKDAPTKTPLLYDLLKKHNPDLVIIALGTNLIWGNYADTLDEQVASFVRLIGPDRTCIWVGPPKIGPTYRKKLEAVSKRLQKALEKTSCRYVDSFRSVSVPPNSEKDEVHFLDDAGKKLAQRWATQVFKVAQVQQVLEWAKDQKPQKTALQAD